MRRTMAGMAATVWTTGTRNSRVHASPDCHSLRAGHARRRSAEVSEVPLDSLVAPILCARCFPKHGRLRVWHPRCGVCGHSRPLPCPHNGAVQVWQPRTGQWRGRVADSEYDPDLVTHVRRWVWPEQAHKYTLVDHAL